MNSNAKPRFREQVLNKISAARDFIDETVLPNVGLVKWDLTPEERNTLSEVVNELDTAWDLLAQHLKIR